MRTSHDSPSFELDKYREQRALLPPLIGALSMLDDGRGVNRQRIGELFLAYEHACGKCNRKGIALNSPERVVITRYEAGILASSILTEKTYKRRLMDAIIAEHGIIDSISEAVMEDDQREAFSLSLAAQIKTIDLSHDGLAGAQVMTPTELGERRRMIHEEQVSQAA